MLNYKRGFQRVYMLLSLAWVLWMLYQPFYERKRAVENAIESAHRIERVCLDGAENLRLVAGLQADQKCFDQFRKNEEELLARAAPPGVDPYQQYVLAEKPWRGIAVLATLCLGPPALVYGLILCIARVGAWVYRGFKG